MTSWSSDGKLSDAWIEYELPAAATVSEVTLKLAQWRRLSYPLRATVDGQEAYRGVTSPTLGYVTLALKPTRGTGVRIQLTGTPRPSNALELTEVTGEQNIDGAAPSRTAHGTLGIVEAELYGPGPGP